jgi:DNA-binding NarL/FixJ family response regulator
MTIRVLVADDQELVRAGFRMILETQADLEVVGEAGDGAEAVTATRRLRPEVVLMTSACRTWTASRPPNRSWGQARAPGW